MSCCDLSRQYAWSLLKSSRQATVICRCATQAEETYPFIILANLFYLLSCQLSDGRFSFCKLLHMLFLLLLSMNSLGVTIFLHYSIVTKQLSCL